MAEQDDGDFLRTGIHDEADYGYAVFLDITDHKYL